MRVGFETCAIEAYERVARQDGGADGFDAAARLCWLLDPVRADLAAPAARKRAKLRAELDHTFPGEAQQFPPGWIK